VSNQQDYADWIGRPETTQSTATELIATRMSGLLNRAAPNVGDIWPETWTWALFSPALRHDAAGSDGHAARGTFMPPVTLPRRMWAGSDLTIERAIRVGEEVKRISTIANVTQTHGRSGNLCFVKVDHKLIGSDGGRMTEEQTIA
jgi:3-methylfumaryl-CoA hydratase